jgi:hypothetical protein
MQVAGKVGDGQHIAVDTHEAGLAAAMRGVDLPSAGIPLRIHIAGDEEGIGSPDHGICLGVELHQDFGAADERLGGITGKPELSCLNVLRTVAEGMLDLQRQLAVVARNDSAIDAVAAARLQLDAEHADAVARHQGIASGIPLAQARR